MDFLYKSGDLVEIVFPKTDQYSYWSGIRFRLTQDSTAMLARGIITHTPSSSLVINLKIGDKISWGIPKALIKVTETEIPNIDRALYLSPFTGKWA